MMDKEILTFGSSTMTLTRVNKGSRKGSYRLHGVKDGKMHVYGTYTTREKAKEKARLIGIKNSQRGDTLATLTNEQIDLVKMVLDEKLTIEDLMPLIVAKRNSSNAKLGATLNAWYEQKINRNDYSVRHQADLKHTVNLLLSHFRSTQLFHTITTSQIDDILSDMLNSGQIGAKRFKDLRAHMVGIWKWAITKQYCTENAPQLIEVPKMKKRIGGHEVLTPKEFTLMIHQVEENFLPWLVIAGFAGLRNSEICGADGRTKDRLKWSDFDWGNRRIIIRPETSKTNVARFTPICDALYAHLKPWLNSTGFVHNSKAPSYYANKREESQTYKLGKLIGGWRNNCLRASRASYRLAETNDIGLTAMEDGHTITQLKSNYLNPRFKEDAELWFSLTPDKVKELIENGDIVDFKKKA